MGKRYYCDYCDRFFQDNMHNRKKHLNGVQHHRAKKAWFDTFRDAATIFIEEQAKKPCRKFIQTGQCVFGSNCRFSHMTKKDMDLLRQHIEAEKQQREDPKAGSVSAERCVEDWLARREKRKAAMNSGRVLKEEDEDTATGSDVPPHFLSIQDLPASLLPPPSGGWKNLPHTEWG
ncbi:zinc finger matrin-type protein 5-like [Scleropages formosus]|uniref:Zinc finger matrin-type protein 5 n=1 Tax=Scleropages formosus TaxID=113540 RepID=A0A0P7Y3R1_SCLFO|nr:zinc finger matrin-type protein 5 [Scleropages formosus]XP_018604470.1 zinc finger matrin-type protein 5 [Scleropages formosus]XP_029108424.1 zinc finger matrin-type protein 5 [Scleropages formosus]KPP60291.1 zinc finger matrin-type protein 5-like [Scleropages formosus]